ncbi:MAG: hypothetical protein QXS42_04540 [Zestosphaera sp.]
MKKEIRVMVYETFRCPEGNEYTAYVILRGTLSVEHVGFIDGGQRALDEFLAGPGLGRGVRLRVRLDAISQADVEGLRVYEDFIKRFFAEVYKLLC